MSTERLTPPTRKPRVELPATIPGTFFVVTYDSLTERYRMYLDDGKVSNYDMGGDPNVHVHYFERQGMLELAERAFSQARGFGAAQVVPGQRIVKTVRLRNEADKLANAKIAAMISQGLSNHAGTADQQFRRLLTL